MTRLDEILGTALLEIARNYAMTRAEFENLRSDGSLRCKYCGDPTIDVIEKDIPPPHQAKLVCKSCGRFQDWLAKGAPEAPPGWQRSKKGNLWRKVGNKILTVFETRYEVFKWVFDGKFSEDAWEDEVEACRAAEDEWL